MSPLGQRANSGTVEDSPEVFQAVSSMTLSALAGVTVVRATMSVVAPAMSRRAAIRRRKVLTSTNSMRINPPIGSATGMGTVRLPRRLSYSVSDGLVIGIQDTKDVPCHLFRTQIAEHGHGRPRPRTDVADRLVARRSDRHQWYRNNGAVGQSCGCGRFRSLRRWRRPMRHTW